MVQNNDIKVRLTLTDGTNPYTINSLDDYGFIFIILAVRKVLIATIKGILVNTG